MTNVIQLTFRNESNDNNNSNVVIFQKNIHSSSFDEIVIAWKVIKNCATGWQHQFDFPLTFEVSASDAWGNSLVNPISAYNGQIFHVFESGSGNSLAYLGLAPSQEEIQVRNDLSAGSINAELYKDERLLASKTGISPGQKAIFQIIPTTIWIGVIPGIQEGQVIDPVVLSDITTELNLLGIASADIVMTGGDAVPNTRPFKFQLENVKYA